MRQASIESSKPLEEQYSTIFQVLLCPLILAILLWISKCIFVVIIPLRALAMSPWLIDDSFIFMRIARNLALGKGYSFDGISPTGGAPLLWTLLTSLNHFFLGPEAAAKATIIESSLFGTASTILVFYIAYRLFNTKIAWGAFLLSMLSAPMFFNSVNGMETSLFTFSGLLVVSLYINTRKFKGGKRNYWFFSIGALLGLTNLIRADGVFLAFAIILLEGFTLFKIRAEDRRAYATQIVALIIGVAVFTLPLVLWSLYASGTLFPANQIGRRFLAWEGAKLADGTVVWPAYVRRVVSNILYLHVVLLSITVGSTFLAVLSIASGLLLKRGALLTQLIAIYLVAYFGTLVVYQGYFPNVHGLRYLNLPGHMLSILVVAFCYQILFTANRAIFVRHVLLIGIIFSLILSSAYQYRQMVPGLDWARDMSIIPFYSDNEVRRWWSFVDWISENLREGTVIAAKDHGRLAYFTNTRIVDLAGIIDPSIITSLKEGSVSSYLERKEVQYVLLPDEGGRPIHNAIRETVDLERVPGAPQQECSGYSLHRVLP